MNSSVTFCMKTPYHISSAFIKRFEPGDHPTWFNFAFLVFGQQVLSTYCSWSQLELKQCPRWCIIFCNLQHQPTHPMLVIDRKSQQSHADCLWCNLAVFEMTMAGILVLATGCRCCIYLSFWILIYDAVLICIGLLTVSKKRILALSQAHCW
jgi:hypothetical protein